MSGFQSIRIFLLRDRAYGANWSKEIFVVKKTVPWTYVISGLNREEIIASFYEKELQKN